MGHSKNLVKVPGLISILRQKVTTDLSQQNILWLGREILSCGISDMKTDILPGKPAYIGKGSYYVADKDAISSLMKSYSPYK